MKTPLISLVKPVNQNNINNPKRNVSFPGGLDSDKFELNESLNLAQTRKEMPKIRTRLLEEFIDRIGMEKKGEKVEIPNCIILIDEHNDVAKDLINWTGENSDCNFVKIAGKDEEALQRGLGKTLSEARKLFTETKKRTLIAVEGFDRLINPEINAFENIEGLKTLMDRYAKDFGATVIFSTKDVSKLNHEAVQPHRIKTQILIPIERKAFDLYNKENESLEVTKALSMRPKNNVATTIFDKNDFEIGNNVVIENKPKLTGQSTESIKPETIESAPLGVDTEKPVDVPPPKNVDVPKEKLPKADDIAKKIEDAPKSSKAFKLIAILVAIGAAIAGVIYFIKNKNKQQGVKENANPPNITSGKQ